MASAIIPAAQAGTGLVGGLLAQSQIDKALKEIAQSRQAAAAGMQNVLESTMKQALPIAQQQHEQGTALNKFGAETTGGLNSWALQNALQAKKEGVQNSIASLQQGANAAQEYLNPYAQIGTNALAGLAKSVSKYPGSGKAFTNAPQQNFPSMGNTPFTPMSGPTAPPAVSFADIAKGSNTGTEQPGVNLENIRKNAGLTNTNFSVRDTIRNAENEQGGFGLHGFENLINLAGPVGILAGKWIAHGRDKVAASKGINAVSDYVWGDLQPAYEKGDISADEYKALANGALQEWSATLPKDVAKNSIEDQLYWFNEDPKSNKAKYKLPFNFEIPGFSAVRHG